MQVHESQDFNEWLASDFFYSTSFRVTTSTFEFSLSFGLLHPVSIYDQLKYKQQYPSFSSHGICGRLTVVGTNRYTLVFTLLVSQSYRASRQADTLSSSLIHLSYLVSAEEKQGHHVERQYKQRASLLTCLHCLRSGVLCCSGLFRWKRLIKKSPVLPKYAGGKTEGQRERRHELRIDKVPVLKHVQGRE